MAKLLGECRCCRKPIHRSKLACPEHWAILPKAVRDNITATYQERAWRSYVKAIVVADKIWQDAGLWRPGVPMSTRADKGVAALKSLALQDGEGR